MARTRNTTHTIIGRMAATIDHSKNGFQKNRRVTAFGIVFAILVFSISFTDKTSIRTSEERWRDASDTAGTKHYNLSAWRSHIQSDTNLTLNEGQTIRYGLFRNKSYPTGLFNDHYLCSRRDPRFNRTQFPNVPAGVFDFSVHMATRLKILFIGDSLGLQFTVWFEKACGVTKHKMPLMLSWETTKSDWINVASEINGGGTIAFWRMLGIWSQANHGKKKPNDGEKRCVPMLDWV